MSALLLPSSTQLHSHDLEPCPTHMSHTSVRTFLDETVDLTLPGPESNLDWGTLSSSLVKCRKVTDQHSLTISVLGSMSLCDNHARSLSVQPIGFNKKNK